MSEALSVLSLENRIADPRESFRTFSRIMCGHPETGGERIPSLNWYEDNSIKSFLGRNGTEDVKVDSDNNTSTQLCCIFFLVIFLSLSECAYNSLSYRMMLDKLCVLGSFSLPQLRFVEI